MKKTIPLSIHNLHNLNVTIEKKKERWKEKVKFLINVQDDYKNEKDEKNWIYKNIFKFTITIN